MKAMRVLLLGLVISLVIVGLRWNLHVAGGDENECKGKARDDDSIAPLSMSSAPPRRYGAGDGSATRPPGPLTEPLQLGQAVPDASLVDQDGREFRLSELRGQVVVTAFIYTHCRVTSMCPLVTAKFVEVQSLLKDRHIAGVHLLLVTFDSERDAPARLKEFSALYRPDSSNFTLATGDAAEVASLSRALNNYYSQSAPGVFEHNIVVSLLDREGILRDDFFGSGWSAEEMVSAIEKLARTPQLNG